MSRPVTSTKPSPQGTFGTRFVACVFDGTKMQKTKKTIIPGSETYICPQCGWIAHFAQ